MIVFSIEKINIRHIMIFFLQSLKGREVSEGIRIKADDGRRPQLPVHHIINAHDEA